MSKDKYTEDHFIEVAGSAGNQTLYVSDNLNVLKRTSTRTLNTRDLTCKDLTVQDDAFFGGSVTDPSDATGESDTFLFDLPPRPSIITFSNASLLYSENTKILGYQDMQSVPANQFLANGFQNEDSIDIKMLGGGSKEFVLYSEGYNYIASAKGTIISAGRNPSVGSLKGNPENWSYSPGQNNSTTNGSIFLDADDDVYIKADDDVYVTSNNRIRLKSRQDSDNTSEISLINSAGGTSVPYGVFLGGGLGNSSQQPVKNKWRWSYYGKHTNDSYTGTSPSPGSGNYASRHTYDSWPGGTGYFCDGWVVPKVEVAHTNWSGYARAVDGDGDGTDKRTQTTSWMGAIPLPNMWKTDIQILGLNYSVRRVKNMTTDYANRNFSEADGGSDIDRGSQGSLEFVGGGMFPDYKYRELDGDLKRVNGISDNTVSHGLSAYIDYSPYSGAYKHLVIRIGSGNVDHEFSRDRGMANSINKVNQNIPEIDSSGDATGSTYNMKNAIGIQVKVLLFYSRRDM